MVSFKLTAELWRLPGVIAELQLGNEFVENHKHTFFYIVYFFSLLLVASCVCSRFRRILCMCVVVCLSNWLKAFCQMAGHSWK